MLESWWWFKLIDCEGSSKQHVVKPATTSRQVNPEQNTQLPLVVE